MNNRLGNEKSLVCSYLELRKTIGLLGIAFPFILSLGALILFQTGIQETMSSYYHTGMRDVFVGTLCVIGFFLLSYKGYERSDDIAGDLACVFAVGIALFPTTPEVAATSSDRIIGYVHLGFATLYFLTLIYFSLFLFIKTDPQKTPSNRKLQRNKIYRICGYTMGICILLIAIFFLLPHTLTSHLNAYKPVFWLESLAVLAFGISWFTKGQAILKD
ncbi:DUF998 domain-containing protein [Candidatus Latescibacterota bacterium]